MKNTEPLVSIICTAYNHEKYISKALDSFVEQETTFPYEVIVHDDASTDQTGNLIRGYEKKYPNIIIPIYQNENQYSKGIGISQKFIIPKARGKYIAWCEGDDYWIDKYKLQKQIDFMENNPKCTFCFSNAIRVNTNCEKIGDYNPVIKSSIISTNDVIEGMGGFCATNTIVTRRELMMNPPQYYQKFPYDISLQIYLASSGVSYGFVDQMAVYRMGVEGSWSHRMNEGDVVKKKVEHYNHAIQMRRAFNEETKGKYDAAIQNAIHINEFEIFLAQKRINELKKEPYRKILMNKTYRQRIGIYLDCYIPNWRRFLKR